MKKIVFTALVAFSVGSLSLLTNNDCNKCARTTAKSTMMVFNDHNVLATAD